MVNILSDVDNRLDIFLKQKGIASRSGAKAGVLISLLLPLSILKGEFKLYFFYYNVKLWIPLSFGLLLHSVLNIVYMKRNVPIYNGLALIPSLVVTALLSFISFDEGTLWKILLTCGLILVYEYGVLNLMKVCSKAFTYGEACVVTQAVILFVASCFIPSVGETCFGDATIILKVGILCVVVISAVSFTFDLGTKPFLFFTLFTTIVASVLIPILFRLIGMNPFIWIFNLVAFDFETTALFCYWICCTLVGIGAIVYQVCIKQKANTIVRKSFHVLSLLVYLPGILINSCLLYLASGVIFAVFIMTDVMRLLKVPFIGPGLEEGFRLFSDEKDMGGMSLTPLYLVAGCSLPLWIHPDPTPNNLLPLLSGLLTVAIGDTAASVCGSLFGRNKWPGTNKTKEGTIACFITQLFFVIALIHFGYLPRKDLIRPVLAVSVASVVEARTSQVDNLVLPLLMYIIVV